MGKVEVLGLCDDDLVSLLSGTKMMHHIFSPWISIYIFVAGNKAHLYHFEVYNLCPSNYFNGKTCLIAALLTKDSSQKCCSWTLIPLVLLLTVVVIDLRCLVFQASSEKHRVGVGFHLTPRRRYRPHKSAPRILIVLSAHTEWLLQFLWLEDNETSLSSAWVYSFSVDFEFFLTPS